MLNPPFSALLPHRRPKQRAVFLDKDGTLVEEVPHAADPGLLCFTPHAATALRHLADRGWLLVVVTHQPGIAEGRFTEAGFATLRQALLNKVRQESGVTLAGVFHCPHAAGESGQPLCACCMPQAGLLQQAARALDIDLSRSWMVGDTLDDVEAGRRAGCRTLFVDRGHETEWRLSRWRVPHHSCADLLRAAEHIQATEPRRQPAGAPLAGREPALSPFCLQTES
jgi:D-glycero-D-manno-heptose 1,7-bisphosphate phosphatase